MVTLRLRDCEPVPHDLVHVVQALKVLTEQWIGHGPCVHGRVSALCGQASPPYAGCTMLRVRCCEPTPHDLVHVVQAPKLRTMQSTGQLCWLHARVSDVCGHAPPPKRGWRLVRVRRCRPLPHDLLHVFHRCQRPGLQSCGQLCVLHWRVSALCGHASPPKRGWRLMRVRRCEPPPHDLVHVV